MDEELESLALEALANAFYEDYSALVNKYLAASEGIDDDGYFEMRMQALSNVYSRDESADIDHDLNIYVGGQNAPGALFKTWNSGCDTLQQALECEGGEEVWLRGKKIFEKRDGEWWATE